MKLLGKMLDEDLKGVKRLDSEPEVIPDPPPKLRLNPPVSITFRKAMIVSISHNWKRSTASAQVNWNRFSFSNFLNTVDLISTN